jgi:NAD(P)-dependent dehydrogenase (short-subunit alcohol dehydrogenase family)
VERDRVAARHERSSTAAASERQVLVLVNRIALVSGANQGMGKHVATELVSDGVTVYVGARDLARGAQAAAEIGDGAIALQLDVTDEVSITAAARRIHEEAGRLDLLVNNAAISTTRTDVRDMAELRESSKASRVPVEEVRAVWEVNVFGPLAVYRAVLPLLRTSSDARIVNVTSAVGSLTTIADPAFPYHSALTGLRRVEGGAQRRHAVHDGRAGRR